jgi:hypothetical protein
LVDIYSFLSTIYTDYVYIVCINIYFSGTGVFVGKGAGANAWDGHKFVCEDDFEPGKPCLVYTFGISNDMSFEDAMASRGRPQLKP